MKRYNLFLDDIRSPLDCHYMPNRGIYFKTEWRIVRNYSQFCKMIEEGFSNGEFPDLISFDHDLADIHYVDAEISKDLYEETYGNSVEKTGKDCAKWLAEFCLGNDITLPQYLVHSQNTVGAENISLFLKNVRDFQNHQRERVDENES